MPIDALDGRLLTLLTSEPRIGVLECSRRLGVARGTVQARLDRLRVSGVIRGFGPQVDPAALGYPVTAFATLEISQGQGQDVREHLAAVPEVLELHTTTGRGDMLCRTPRSSTGCSPGSRGPRNTLNGVLPRYLRRSPRPLTPILSNTLDLSAVSSVDGPLTARLRKQGRTTTLDLSTGYASYVPQRPGAYLRMSKEDINEERGGRKMRRPTARLRPNSRPRTLRSSVRLMGGGRSPSCTRTPAPASTRRGGSLAPTARPIG